MWILFVVNSPELLSADELVFGPSGLLFRPSHPLPLKFPSQPWSIVPRLPDVLLLKHNRAASSSTVRVTPIATDQFVDLLLSFRFHFVVGCTSPLLMGKEE